MKKFNFRLEKILRLRKFREEECKFALMQAVSVLNEIENNIKENAGKQHHASQMMFSDPGQIADWNIYILRLEQEARALMEQAAQAQLVVEEKRALYMKASRELKAIEKLREKRQKEYKEEMQAAEMAELEDISIARFYSTAY